MKKNITFVLPQYPLHISGGYKMVFEYANRFVRDGYNVTIVFLNDGAPHFLHIPSIFKKEIMNIITKKKIKWYPIDTRIHIVSSTQLKIKKVIANTSVVFATAAITVKPVLEMFTKSKKIYLIQDFEKWDMSCNELYKTYNAGLKNIVISKWLKDMVTKHTNKEVIYIQNPIDTDIYKVKIPINKRNKYTLGLLYHKAPHKGIKYSLEAIKKVKKVYPNLKLVMFGSEEAPKNLPEWISYHKNASQNETVDIYNNVSIFVCGTINEGFGLTGVESMACGDALVSTDYLGVREYAENNINALLSPIKDVDSLANNICSLIHYDKKRVELAQNASKDVKKYSWDIAFNKLKQVVDNL